MNSDDRFEDILRAAVRPMPADLAPSRDLWQVMTDRDGGTSIGWIWIDLGLAAAVLFSLLRSPGWIWLLAYHF